ncbi:hypothetical protein JYU34_005198 [Plutella xylostella]|uniref:Reverse transcriptase domain-containing protein n=1 Tax=Plutella xylostella TaxID=51655 RepID=A0ABQ7QW27_PLUXY|nr:hypothetical protein JYU34_005198 [Plutella xylostella]
MPTDKADHFPEFTVLLGKIHALIDERNASDCLIVGDFNADPRKPFGRELELFCAEYDYKYTDRLLLPPDSYTYVSDAHNTTSWLDHCLATERTHGAIRRIDIDYSVSWTDHRSLHLELDIDTLTSYNENQPKCNQYAWKPRSMLQINHYSEIVETNLHHYLTQIIDVSNMNENSIDNLCSNIITTMQQASIQAFTKNTSASSRRRRIPGWNKHVADCYAASKRALSLWHESGRPVSGDIAENRKQKRKMFKNSLKDCQKRKDQILMDKLTNDMACKNFSSFWNRTNSLIKAKNVLPSHINGITDDKNIAEEFSAMFTQPPPPTSQNMSTHLQSNHSIPNDKDRTAITSNTLCKIIKEMARGKSPGLDGLSIEHIQNSGIYTMQALTLLYNSILTTSHIPKILAQTVVTPILKNAKKDKSSSGNYRPIALASIIARLLEKVLHSMAEVYLTSEPNQMGFKHSHSTVTCVYTLKQIASYYKKRKTSIYACFLDLSKAFDRVAHEQLWNKIENRGAPTAIVKVLSAWYKAQRNVVRWNGVLSEPVGLSCGVRQGGSMSPVLFNLYMDDLNKQLTQTQVGCSMHGTMVNNICYADDMVLLAPSISAMRELLSVCEKYADDHNMQYNADKSEYMIFQSENTPTTDLPLILKGETLRRAEEVKYLGHIINSRLSDDADIERQRRAVTVRANMLARRFQRCSGEVKRQLFLTYCTSVYTVELWSSHTVEAMRRMRVQYNHAWRALFRLPYHCSASGMFAAGRAPGWAALLRRRSASTRAVIFASDNPILCAVRQWPESPLHDTWRKYHVSFL